MRSQKVAAKAARRKARRAVQSNTEIQDKLIASGRLLQKGREQFGILTQRAAEVTYRETIEEV